MWVPTPAGPTQPFLKLLGALGAGTETCEPSGHAGSQDGVCRGDGGRKDPVEGFRSVPRLGTVGMGTRPAPLQHTP